jgi:hypothetical protein
MYCIMNFWFLLYVIHNGECNMSNGSKSKTLCTDRLFLQQRRELRTCEAEGQLPSESSSPLWIRCYASFPTRPTVLNKGQLHTRLVAHSYCSR